MTKRDISYLIIIGFLLFCLYQSACTGKHETISVPEKTGKFEAVKPVQTPIISRVIMWRNNPTVKENLTVQNDTINERLLSENAMLIHDFKTASDSLKLAKFDKAIELKDFSNTFEDSLIKIDVSGKVRGEVQFIGIPKYTIKKSAIVIPKAKPKPFGIGVFVGYGTDLKPVAGVGLSYNIIRF